MTTQDMSNTQNPHFAAFNEADKVSFIRDFNVKLATEIPGYRHSVIRYRVITAKQQQGEIKPTKLVTVPQLILPSYLGQLDMPKENTEEFVKLASVLLATLEDGQDSMIREIVDSGKTVTVQWSEITLDKVITFLTTARTGARLTRESVEAWVMNETMQDTIKQRAAELHLAKQQAGVNDGKTLEVRTAELANRYKQLIGGLAAAVPTLKQNEAEACETIIQRSKLDDDTSRSLMKKLDAMLRPKVVADGDL